MTRTRLLTRLPLTLDPRSYYWFLIFDLFLFLSALQRELVQSYSGD